MYELIKLTTQEEADEEGKGMENAIGHFFPKLMHEGAQVFSLRRDGVAVLTLTAHPVVFAAPATQEPAAPWICQYVAGFRNRQPTQLELAMLSRLLRDKGVQLRYNPRSLY